MLTSENLSNLTILEGAKNIKIFNCWMLKYSDIQEDLTYHWMFNC